MKLLFFILSLIFSITFQQLYIPVGQGILRYKFCRDPHRIDLDRIYLQLEAKFLLMDKNNLTYNIFDFDFTDGLHTELVGNYTVTSQSTIARICSMTQNLYKNRKWRYPFERSLTKCSVKIPGIELGKNNGKNPNINCTEVSAILPALLKTGKCIDGVFEWVSIFERVPKSCGNFK
jgi:hypothetical protein